MRHKIYNLTDHWYPDKIGGSCLYAYKMHRLLGERVPVETVTLQGDPAPEEHGMTVHKVLSKANILKNRTPLRELDSEDATWVIHSPWFFLHLLFALGPRARKRMIGVYHGPWYREYWFTAAARRRKLIRPFVMATFYLIDALYSLVVPRFIFLSETMYRAVSEYLPLARSKAHIVPMWTAQDRWDSPSERNDPLLLSTFRRLEPRMGLQDLIAALDRCDIEDYRLVICGGGSYRDELLELVKKKNLSEKVELRGWVSEEEKIELIQKSDAVVLPSKTLEGFSLVALESLELGTPVMLTEVVGFYEYVRELEQDFVHKIDLDADAISVREFLSKGRDRSGLSSLKSIFEAATVRDSLLEAIVPGLEVPPQPAAELARDTEVTRDAESASTLRTDSAEPNLASKRPDKKSVRR